VLVKLQTYEVRFINSYKITWYNFIGETLSQKETQITHTNPEDAGSIFLRNVNVVTSQKTVIFIVSSVPNSNFAQQQNVFA
jgi:hypothetical protein